MSCHSKQNLHYNYSHMGGTMTGLEFYLIVITATITAVGGYVVGYRTGWTDGAAKARKFADR